MGSLQKRLEEYAGSDYYPYHMPGHKRRLFGKTLATVAAWDITEIEGFDNLHEARGILHRLQLRAAEVYGAEESFFLVNGSTSGILSAVSAALPKRGKLLMVRGCHKSAYHAAYLRSLEISYLLPGMHPEFGCTLAATAAQVERALAMEPDIGAVLIVSPTYEGLTAETAEIAEIVHRRGIPLIVDEAHGAHLGFHAGWQLNASRLGADLAVQSLHKTLPSMTQTAILHVNGELINRGKLKRFLEIYQSSSPSYIFMAGMEEAIEMTAAGAEKLFGDFEKNWHEMLERLNKCKVLHFLQEKNMDKGKLVIMDCSGRLSGRQLYDTLLNQYHLQLEMAAGRYALAMFTIGDTVEGYERLTKALLSIDGELDSGRVALAAAEPSGRQEQWICLIQQFPLYEAWDKETEKVPLAKAAGRVAGCFIVLYPPDIPVVVPGEIITEEICHYLQTCVRDGLTVQGMEKQNCQLYVEIIK